MAVKAVQQFMLGTVMNNEAQARDTMQKMKAAGYDGIELCGFMIHPAGLMVRLMTKAAGMPVGKGGKLDWKGLVKLGQASTTGNGLTLQIGDTADTFNQMQVVIGDMHTTGGMNIESLDIGTLAGAQKAIGMVTDATNYVSSIRGDLGAIQNRLDHTLNNLSVMAENIQDAESTIRDTDVANEMMSYVKNNILVQSAQAMLAQANQVPQGVLQLLG